MDENITKMIDALYIIMKTTADEDSKLIAANALLEAVESEEVVEAYTGTDVVTGNPTMNKRFK